MKRWIHCETDNKLHIDPVSKTLVKPDIDIGGKKYDAEDQVSAIDYMYGYGSLPKARKAIVDGKYSEDDIKRSILYKETEGLPFKDRKEMYQRNLKKYGLDEEDAIESSTISASSFDDWYNSLHNKEQDKVDNLADEMGLPLYAECTDAELASLHDSFTSNNVTSSCSKVTASTQNMSQCSFDFDLGDDYDEEYIDNQLTDIFEDFGAEVIGTDYHSVDYTLAGDPELYSQCTVDYVWYEPIDGDALEDAISELINDQGGNLLGLDVNSL